MNETDLQLLASYARDRAEDAFAEVVRRHLDLVYSAALRQVQSPQLARDVSQSVFTDLARNAGSLRKDTIVTAWLYEVTRRTAIDAIRREVRRQWREQLYTEMNAINATTEDWRHIFPHLEDAMAELDKTDRAAVLLRFFENKSLRAVGQELGISDDAAQKRVSRAVERLRELLAKRDITVGVSGLALAISTGAVHAAPTGLAATLTSASLAAAAAGSGTAFTLLKLMTMTKLQTAMIGAMVVAVVATPLVIHEQAQIKSLAAQNGALQQRADQLSPLIAAMDGLSNRLEKAEQAQPGSRQPSNELLRLRSEVTRLRSDAQQLAEQRANDPIQSASEELLAKVNLLKQRLDENPGHKIPELRYLGGKDWLRLTQEARLRDENPSDDQVLYALATVRSAAKQQLAYWMQPALLAYVQANGGQLPARVAQLEPYFDRFHCPVDDATLERYQMLKTGNVNDLPPGALVVGENAPVDDQYDTLWQIGLTNFVWQGTGKYRAFMHGGWPPH